MGLCSGNEDCPVLESTERVKTGAAKKYTSMTILDIYFMECPKNVPILLESVESMTF